jgi:hypothetical protein
LMNSGVQGRTPNLVLLQSPPQTFKAQDANFDDSEDAVKTYVALMAMKEPRQLLGHARPHPKLTCVE